MGRQGDLLGIFYHASPAMEALAMAAFMFSEKHTTRVHWGLWIEQSHGEASNENKQLFGGYFLMRHLLPFPV